MIRDWNKMKYKEFKKLVDGLKQDYLMELFLKQRSSFQIKKEKTIAKNLERIFTAALSISNKKGFHAMSMRELSQETKLSIGALYNYFSGKDELLELMQEHRRTITRKILRDHIDSAKDPSSQLKVGIRIHLYLSEAMVEWFYFSYMEAKNLNDKARHEAVQSELWSESVFADIISAGVEKGVFKTEDNILSASLIKAMLQDWYVKRSKYARRSIDVDMYADFLIAFIEKSLS